MTHFHMKTEWLGTGSEVPFVCQECDKCGAFNWYAGRNPEPGDKYETDAFRCWKCYDVTWVDDFAEKDCRSSLADALVCQGEVDPMIPKHCLQAVIDAAKEQFDDWKWAVRSEEDDPELVDMIQEVRTAINYVSRLMYEGTLPTYLPPVKFIK